MCFCTRTRNSGGRRRILPVPWDPNLWRIIEKSHRLESQVWAGLHLYSSRVCKLWSVRRYTFMRLVYEFTAYTHSRYSQGSTNFPKSGSQLEILGATTMTWIKFLPEDSLRLGTVVRIFVCKSALAPGICAPLCCTVMLIGAICAPLCYTAILIGAICAPLCTPILYDTADRCYLCTPVLWR